MIVREKSISRQASMEACLFAIQKAEELKIAINVSIVDNKGLEMAFLRMENSFIHSSEIAKDKAYTSASFGFPTDTWTEDELWRGIFYHTGVENGAFTTAYTLNAYK